MNLRQEMLGEFRDELPTTECLLERVPEDKLAWQPHPRSMASISCDACSSRTKPLLHRGHGSSYWGLSCLR